MTVLTFRYDHALGFTSSLHRTQMRKGTTIPYIAHLVAVSGIVLENGGDEDAAISALLHDAAEDQGGEPTLNLIRQIYGEAVAKIVYDCTDSWIEQKPEWRPRKEAYIASLEHKQDASLLVSLADKTHNATAILGDYRQCGDALWSRFTTGRQTLWYYDELAKAFSRLRPCPLAAQFGRTVAELLRVSA